MNPNYEFQVKCTQLLKASGGQAGFLGNKADLPALKEIANIAHENFSQLDEVSLQQLTQVLTNTDKVVSADVFTNEHKLADQMLKI